MDPRALAGWAFLMLLIGTAVWIAYLIGLAAGGKGAIEIYELGVRDGKSAGHQEGLLAGLNEAGIQAVQFSMRCLAILEIPPEVQQATIKAVAHAMEEEAQLEQMTQSKGDQNEMS